MLLSFNWLKKFVNLPDSITPEEVAEKLKMSTVEVESVKRLGENLEKIVVGKVESVQAHPNADKLKVCTVAFGEKYPVQVVCGGSNVKEGMLVALAGLGAKVRWHGEGELVELQKVKIRDIESYGMICASTEIGLGEIFPIKDEKEILDLTDVIPAKAGISDKRGDSRFRGNDIIGKPLAEVLKLNDAILEIDNKSLSNRPDLWSHYGIAREVAVLFRKKLIDYKVKDISKTKNSLSLSVRVEEPKLCPRYMAVAIEGVEIKESPAWLKEKLQAVGLRSINNIVDITNYVMYELGQPLHAFDESKVKKSIKSKVEITVLRARDKEKFVTLDEVERELSLDDLMITDGEKSLALAGVMGGVDSGINSDTKTIIFESANFEAANIRQTSSRLGLRTDSSVRFEKSLDPNLCEVALKKAVELTLELCPQAKVASSVVDVKNFHLFTGPIELTCEFFVKKIGLSVDKKEIRRILETLGFTLKDNKKKDGFLVTIPSWRATKDIAIAEDLVEEIVRIFGYENIPATLPNFSIIPPPANQLRILERKIKNQLTSQYAYSEVYNYSFVSPDLIKKFDLQNEGFIELANPIAKDRPFVRRNLWLGLVENAEKNLHNFAEVKLFEIGKVFNLEEIGLRVSEKSDELLPRQDLYWGLLYSAKSETKPFYEVANTVLEVLKNCGCEPVLKKKEGELSSFIHGGRQAQIFVGEMMVGALAEINPLYTQKVGIDSRVAVAEINLEKLLPFLGEKNTYQKLSDYPEVIRDIAFVVDKKLEHQKIVEILKNIDPLILRVELFDVYDPSTFAQGRGKNLGEDKKSLAYHLTYGSKERTLVSEEVDKIQEKVTKTIEQELKGEIRK